MSGRLASNLGAATAASLFGASLIAISVLRANSVGPFTIGLIRFAGAAVVLAIVLYFVGRHLLRVGMSDVKLIALAGFVGFGLFAVTFNVGLGLTTASRAALLIGTLPIWSMILARRLTGERLGPRQVSGVLLTVAGVAMVMGTRGFGAGQLLGDGLILATAVLGALYAVLAKRAIARNRAITVTLYAMVAGCLLLAPVSIVEGVPGILPELGSENWLLLAFASIPGAAIAWFLWTWSLERLSPTQTAVYVNFNPLVATILAAWLLDEVIDVWFLIGFGMVLTGVVLANVPERRPLPAEAAQVSR